MTDENAVYEAARRQAIYAEQRRQWRELHPPILIAGGAGIMTQQQEQSAGNSDGSPPGSQTETA